MIFLLPCRLEQLVLFSSHLEFCPGQLIEGRVERHMSNPVIKTQRDLTHSGHPFELFLAERTDFLKEGIDGILKKRFLKFIFLSFGYFMNKFMQNGEEFMLIAFLSLVKSEDSLLKNRNQCFYKLVVPAL